MPQPSDPHISDLDDVFWFIDHMLSKMFRRPRHGPPHAPLQPLSPPSQPSKTLTVFSDLRDAHFQPGNSKRRPARNRMEIIKLLSSS